MNPCNGQLARVTPPLQQVYIRTLGAFDAQKNKLELIWEGAGVGANKLRRGLAHLIAKRNQPVCRETLIDLTGTRNIISGITNMLHDWGMGSAIVPNRQKIILQPHTSWYTDTDQLDEALRRAEQLRATGDTAGYIAALQDIQGYCGGLYLPDYDSLLDHTIGAEQDYWQQRQKDALRQVAHAWLNFDLPERSAAAMRAAALAISFDRENPDSYLFAAQIARRCGNEDRARYYEREARRRGGRPPPV